MADQVEAKVEAVYQKVKAYLDARDKSVPSLVPHSFKFVITYKEAIFRTFVVDLVHFTISKEDGPAEVTATLDVEWVKKVFTHEIDVVEAYKQGKMMVEGNKDLLEKLKPFLAKLNQA